MLWSVILVFLKAITVVAKTLDNRLVDAPVVTCGPDAIRVKGESEDVFEGQIFIKNQRRSTDCFVVYSEEQNSTTPEFSLPLTRLSSCGIDIRRNPTRGLELFSVFVFAFHPSFVTAGDRAFAVHCLFQQEQITVSTRFDFISDITPKALLGSTSSLPKINFQIVQGRVPTGEKVAGQVHVGQPLMLVWTLEETSKDISSSQFSLTPHGAFEGNSLIRLFGLFSWNNGTWISIQRSPSMRCHELYGLRMLDCTAETHDGRGMSIIRDGCTMDDMLISDIRYSEDYRRAFADATAFKFPDLSDVWFKCMVRFCIRKSDHLLLTGASEYHLCGNISKCDVKSLRVRRSTTSVQDHYDENVIMVTGRLTVEKDAVFYNYAAQVSSPETSTVCLAKDTVALGSAVSMTICASTILTVASLIYSKVKITSSPR